MKQRNPAFIILIFLFWYYSTIRERKKPLLQDIFHKVRVTNLTQGGLKAMKELAVIERERLAKQRGIKPDDIEIKKASDEMCTFLVINISSLQLIPVSVIAYRAQYGAVNPAAIVLPGLIATLVSTVVAVIFCRVMCQKGER